MKKSTSSSGLNDHSHGSFAPKDVPMLELAVLPEEGRDGFGCNGKGYLSMVDSVDSIFCENCRVLQQDLPYLWCIHQHTHYVREVGSRKEVVHQQKKDNSIVRAYQHVQQERVKLFRATKTQAKRVDTPPSHNTGSKPFLDATKHHATQTSSGCTNQGFS